MNGSHHNGFKDCPPSARRTPHDAPFTPLITCTPGGRSGNPCMAGTRIAVSDVLEYLASGMNQEDILADFSDLQPEHIRAVCAMPPDARSDSANSPWTEQFNVRPFAVG